eukprot:801328-Lingulodinium_polyedra.AAC.1
MADRARRAVAPGWPASWREGCAPSAWLSTPWPATPRCARRLPPRPSQAPCPWQRGSGEASSRRSRTGRGPQ